jgi:Asp-tRNA(Asn)/Glu-tRNA(Gln) amidotransferase A subunit family amidase
VLSTRQMVCDEPDDLLAGGSLGGSDADPTAVPEHDETIGHREDVLQVVADGQHRLALGLEVGDQLVDLLAEMASLHSATFERLEEYGPEYQRLLTRGQFVHAADYLHALGARHLVQLDFERAFTSLDAMVVPQLVTEDTQGGHPRTAYAHGRGIIEKPIVTATKDSIW